MNIKRNVYLGLIISFSLFVTSTYAMVREGFDSSSLAKLDDINHEEATIGFTINFLGTSYTSVFVNDNGNITLDNFLETFNPFNLETTSRVIIAPFFADVDTSSANGGVIRYGTNTINGQPAFGAVWDNVGYFNQHTDKLNRFQVVLIDRSDVSAGDFDIEFNYDRIEWETGDDVPMSISGVPGSGGANGFGGSSARVGLSNGSNFSQEVTGSGIPGSFLDGGPQSLSTVGRIVFAIRNGGVSNISTPLPQLAALNTPLVFSASDGRPITVNAPDGNTLTLDISVANGTFSLNSTAGLVFTLGDGMTDAAMRFSGTADAINTALTDAIFTPATDFLGSASLALTATEAGATEGDSATIAITVVEGNQPPAVSVPDLQILGIDTPLTFSTVGGNTISVSDVDAGGNNVAVSLAPINGTLAPIDTLGNTLTVQETLGSSGTTVTLIGSLSVINNVLDGLMFTPDAGFVGDAGITITANDQGFTGLPGILQIQTATGNVEIVVTDSTNQAPVNIIPGPQTAFSGVSLLFSTDAGNAITLTDPDAGNNPVQVELNATNGTINLNSTAELTFVRGDGVNDVNVSFIAPLSIANAVLDGMSFTPFSGFTGFASIQVVTNDQGFIGLGGAQQDADDFIEITVQENPGFTLTLSPPAGGRVTSVPAGINCGTACIAAFEENATVILIPEADAGFEFTGWGGACDANGQVTLTDDATCAANFAPSSTGNDVVLNVNIAGNGAGLVTSEPAAIDCGSVCSAVFPLDTVVTLTATPLQDAVFSGWGGACSGSDPTVQVTLAQSSVCTANFDAVTTDDGDGVPFATENDAPNNGDGNGDGIMDSMQNHVVSLPMLDGIYATLVTTPDCTINAVQLTAPQAGASPLPVDGAFDYPRGLLDLNATCASMTVTVFYHSQSNLQASPFRQYAPTLSDPAVSEYRALPVSFGSETVGGIATPTIEFSLQDDSADDSNTVTGIIRHISGPATPVVNSVQFDNIAYTIGEASGSLTIQVLRRGSSQGAVSVNYFVQAGTAVFGEDFSATNGLLSWADGDVEPKSFAITILNDSLFEGSETLNLSLSGPIGGIQLGTPATAVVTIEDDEALRPVQQTLLLSVGGLVQLRITGGIGNRFVSQSPDVAIVTANWQPSQNTLTLSGRNPGTTRLIISDSSVPAQNSTIDIQVIGEPSVCTPDGLKVDAQGAIVASQSCFEESIITATGNKPNQIILVGEEAANVTLSTTVTVDSVDLLQPADIILVAVLTTPFEVLSLTRDTVFWYLWDGRFDSLQIAGQHEQLPTAFSVPIISNADFRQFHGVFTIYVGYRLSDNSVVFSGLDPLQFEVR